MALHILNPPILCLRMGRVLVDVEIQKGELQEGIKLRSRLESFRRCWFQGFIYVYHDPSREKERWSNLLSFILFQHVSGGWNHQLHNSLKCQDGMIWIVFNCPLFCYGGSHWLFRWCPFAWYSRQSQRDRCVLPSSCLLDGWNPALSESAKLWMVQKSQTTTQGCIKPCKWWDKLATPTGYIAGFLLSTVWNGEGGNKF